LAALSVIALSCGDGRHIKYEYLPPAASTACNNNRVPLQKVPESKTQHTMNALPSGWDGKGWDWMVGVAIRNGMLI